MSTPSRPPVERLRSSKRRYLRFVDDYVHGRLDLHQQTDGDAEAVVPTPRGVISAAAPGAVSTGQAAPERRRLRGLAVAAPVSGRRGVRPGAGDRRPRDGGAAVHALHRRQRAADVGAARRAAEPAAPGRRPVRDGGGAVAPVQRAQGLPPAPAQHPGDAGAAPVAVRPDAAPAAADAVGHEDRRHPVAHHRRRGYHHRPAAAGDHLAVDLRRAPADRGGGAVLAELAAGVDRPGHHPGHHLHQLHRRAPRPADLPHAAQGRRADRRPRRRDLLRHPRRAGVPPRVARAAGVPARPPHGAAQGALRPAPRDGDLGLVGAAAGRGQRGDRVVRRLPQPARPGLGRRHHGLPVVHVPAAQPGLEHRQLVLRAAAVAVGDGTGVRRARDGRGQAGRARTRWTRRWTWRRCASST